MTTNNARSTEDDPPSIAVIEAVARRKGTDPTELSPLFEAVDPRALDRLVEGGASVSFDYAGHRVYVTETGEITVQ